MQDELIDVVDEQDKVVGESMKSESHRKGLWHRGAGIFVFNDKDELLLQTRGPLVKRPLKLCSSAAGHLIKGDSYEQGAIRELKEELGITAELTFIGKYAWSNVNGENDFDNEHCVLYSCKHNGPFSIQKEELELVEFFSIEKIKQMIQENPNQFTKGFIKDFEVYLENI